MLNWIAPDLVRSNWLTESVTTGFDPVVTPGSELQPSVTQHTPLFTQKAVIIRP